MSSSQSTSAGAGGGCIRAIDSNSVHRITSGQVVIDLQTAVKELVENSLDAGATSIEIRFKNYGLKSIEVIDNGSGISETDFDSIGRKHHTSKLSAFHDLTTLSSFGFRGEALSSLCALCDGVSVATATRAQAPMGAVLELDRRGEVKSKTRTVRQRGTTVALTTPFSPLPVRRKELERNIKREFGKALALLNAYALGPCSGLGSGKTIRLFVTNQPEKGTKTTQLSLPLPSSSTTASSLSTVRAGVTSLWGSKALDGVVDLALEVEVPKVLQKVKGRRSTEDDISSIIPETFTIGIKGLISSPTPGSGSTPRPGANGRTSNDRQFFYINGRPCTLNKVQKVINEVYRTFLPSTSTTGQFPFVIIDFTIPGNAVDVNVTPDKRTILIHAEAELCQRMKDVLEGIFSPSRSTYGVNDLRLIPKNTSTEQSKESSSLRAEAGQGSDEDNKGATVPSKQLKLVPVGNICGSPSEDEDTSVDIERPPDIADRAGSPLSESPMLQPASKTLGETHVVVVDTSTAAWNRLRRSSTAPLELQTLDRATMTPPSIESLSHASDDEMMGPPKKKRRSTIDVSDEDIYSVDSTAEREGRRVAQKGIRKISQLPVDKVTKAGKQGTAIPKQIKLTNIFRGKTTRQEMRSQLAGFARSGSQVHQLSSDVDEDEGGHNMPLAQDEAETQDIALPFTSPRAIRNSNNGPLFLPEDDDGSSSMTMDTSDDALSSRKLRMSASSASSVSINASIPESSSLLGSSMAISSEKSSGLVDLTLDDDDSPSLLSPANLDQSKAQLHRPEVIRTETSQSSTEDIRLKFDLSQVTERWSVLHDKLRQVKARVTVDDNDTRISALTQEAGVSSGDAEAALSRVISKEDFKEMEVLGQFNLGFIVVRRRKIGCSSGGGSHGEDTGVILDDLFIVDQHAADEKYNFETLQQTTKIHSQKLFKAQPLELTASDELVTLENLDMLRLNGFEVEMNEDGQEEENSDVEMLDDSGSLPPRMHHRLKLVAQPVSKTTVFDMGDLEELVQLMHDCPPGQMVRCSKARTMFASRACRKSVMIGMPLNKSQMSTVVTHMGTIEQPWNCPHGRPTMRHLFDMANVRHCSQNDRARREIDWASFL